MLVAATASSRIISARCSALLRLGIDLGASADAPIDYRQYDGARFPAPGNAFDAVLLCYVLHHAQDVSVVLTEIRRVIQPRSGCALQPRVAAAATLGGAS